jgi:threonine synthase
MRVTCPECQTQADLRADRYGCSCGGAWEPAEASTFDASRIDQTDASIWRYRDLFALDPGTLPVRFGAGWTPLLPVRLGEHEVHVKLEYFAPTASFKDRGTEVMITILAAQGVTHVADDSSGNAGASVAAYAARAGMQADVFVPAYASPAKQAQIAVYGAHIHPIPGPRLNAKLAVLEAARQGINLASHSYHPGFLLGQESVAWEVWEQLGHRAPDWYVVPVGQGVHLLGVWLGFRRLLAAGLIQRLPRLVGVQPERLAPVARAFAAGLDTVPALDASAPSIAEGLAIAQPVRGRRLLQALRETNGACVTVSEEDILAAQHELALKGLYVEPTSAAAPAALATVAGWAAPGDKIVIPLTGSGLKGAPVLH